MLLEGKKLVSCSGLFTKYREFIRSTDLQSLYVVIIQIYTLVAFDWYVVTSVDFRVTSMGTLLWCIRQLGTFFLL